MSGVCVNVCYIILSIAVIIHVLFSCAVLHMCLCLCFVCLMIETINHIFLRWSVKELWYYVVDFREWIVNKLFCLHDKFDCHVTILFDALSRCNTCLVRCSWYYCIILSAKRYDAVIAISHYCVRRFVSLKLRSFE